MATYEEEVLSDSPVIFLRLDADALEISWMAARVEPDIVKARVTLRFAELNA